MKLDARAHLRLGDFNRDDVRSKISTHERRSFANTMQECGWMLSHGVV